MCFFLRLGGDLGAKTGDKISLMSEKYNFNFYFMPFSLERSKMNVLTILDILDLDHLKKVVAAQK